MAFLEGFIEFARMVNALGHTGRYLEHAGQSDHHSLSEVFTHGTETYAGLRRYSSKDHSAKMRGPLGLLLWARRSSHHHPKNRG